MGWQSAKRSKSATRSATAALLLLAMLLAGCGGGDSAAPLPSFTLTGVNPSTSEDLNGGERVTITGSNLEALKVAGSFGGVVMFGAAIGFNPVVVDDETLEVTVPPAPGGTPGAVTIQVKVDGFPTRSVPGLFTYVGLSGAPTIASIFPTSFTPSGAEQFTIQGSNLGLDGSTTDVIFEQVGSVQATVSSGGQIAVGLAPLVAGTPPATSISVTVDNGIGSTVADTRVSYTWSVPTAVHAPSQRRGGASRPVRLNDSVAVVSTAGPNPAWGDPNDEILLIHGPPGSVGMTAVRDSNGQPAGRLDPVGSLPLRLDDDTFAVYSVGPNGIARDGDDQLIVVDASQNPPTMVRHGLPFYPNTTPMLALSSTQIVMSSLGAVNPMPPAPPAVATASDEVVVITLAGAGITVTHTGALGPMDATAGTALSRPFTYAGDYIYVVTMGTTDFLPRTTDDNLHRIEVATMVPLGSPGPAPVLTRGIPDLYGDPIALANDLVVVPGAGMNTVAGSPDDVLMVFRVISGALSRVDRPLGTAHGFGAPVSIARVGVSGVVMPLAVDPVWNNSIEEIGVFLDPVSGTIERYATSSGTLLAPLRMDSSEFGSRSVMVFDRGVDFVAGTGDEKTSWFDGDFSAATVFQTAVGWRQLFVPSADRNRVFVVSAGADGVPLSGDERLLVHQTLVAGAGGLDLADLPILGANAPVDDGLPLIPIGYSWGVIQSPGANGLFGPVSGGDDQILVVHY